MRAKAASAEGDVAVRVRASSTVGGQSASGVAPHAETAVRSASIGLAWRGRARSTVMTASGTGAVGSRYAGSQSPVQSRFATTGIGAVLDEIADAVAPVEQSSALTVDLAERGFPGQDTLEAG